jgi:hypothetical protein
MILIDLNQVVISNLMVQINKLSDEEELDQNLIKHMILNSILSIKKRFANDYGNIVICCDNKNFWRKDVFPYYKGTRKKTREDSGYDWNLIFNTITQTKQDLREVFPYKIIEVDRTEADDIIGTLTKQFSTKEKILIISSDKDFKQLQRYPNVTQYSPILKKFLVTEDPYKYIREHIIRGDRGDGVPNVLSDDDVFVNEKRQKPLSKKKLEDWLDTGRNPEDFCDANMLARYRRNEQLVDLTFVPAAIQEEVLSQFSKTPEGDMQKVFNYFIENKMVLMMDEISNFKEQEYETFS